MDNLYPVLLLGANERACFSVAKNLKKYGYQIEVASWFNHPIASSKFVSAFHLLPSLELNIQKFKEGFIQLVSERKYKIVLPINDLAVEFLNRYKNELNELIPVGGINEPDVIKYAQDKFQLLNVCRELGMNVPRTTIIYSLDDFHKISDTISYPIIAKPVSSRRVMDNKIYGFTVRKFSNKENLEDFIRERILVIPIMLQDLVHGFGIGFNFLAKDGDVLAYYLHERINEPKGGGESSYRKTVVNDSYDCVNQAKQLIKKIKWNGVGMLELKVSNGQAYVMELNGRFWGSIELGIFAGMEIPYWQMSNYLENKNLVETPVVNKRLVYARNFRNDTLQMVKQRSLRGFLKWIVSLPKMMRTNEVVEDSIFRDFKFRILMWWDIPARAVSSKFTAWRRGRLPMNLVDLKTSNSILFLCEGNICRSSFAEVYLKKTAPHLVISSAGMQFQSKKMSPLNALKAARHFGVSLEEHVSRYIGDLDLQSFETIICMDRKIYQKLIKLEPGIQQKTFFLHSKNEIADPYGRNLDQFILCYQQIKDCLDHQTNIAA